LQVSDGNIAITNTDNTARELRLYEPSGSGTNYTAFRAQAQASDITYTLPGSLTPTSTVGAGILQTDASGNLSWLSPAALVTGSAWALTGNAITGTEFLGTTNAQPLIIRTNNLERMRITATGDVGIGTTAPAATLHVVGTAQVSGNTSVGADLSVGGNGSVTGNLTVAGNTTLGDAATDVVVFTARVGSHVVPSADDAYDLGSSSLQWANIYGVNGSLSGSLTVAGTLNVGNGIVVVGDLSTSGGTVAFSATATLTNTGSALTLPDDVVVVEIVDGAGAANINVNPPTSGTQGQLLFIRYSGTQNLTLFGVLPGGGNQTATAQFHAILMYIGGGWRLMSFVD
jgi:cytoskeletal protein CcmA (bactofilin family)